MNNVTLASSINDRINKARNDKNISRSILIKFKHVKMKQKFVKYTYMEYE